MKKLWILFFLFPNLVFAAREDILGKWISTKYKDGNQIIIEVIEKEDGKFYGKMIDQTVPFYQEGEFQGKEKMDLKNPDPSLKHRKLVGVEMLKSIAYQEEKDRYDGGTVYTPGMGKTLYASVQVEKDSMKMKGSFDKAGILGKTQLWHRYEK